MKGNQCSFAASLSELYLYQVIIYLILPVLAEVNIDGWICWFLLTVITSFLCPNTLGFLNQTTLGIEDQTYSIEHQEKSITLPGPSRHCYEQEVLIFNVQFIALNRSSKSTAGIPTLFCLANYFYNDQFRITWATDLFGQILRSSAFSERLNILVSDSSWHLPGWHHQSFTWKQSHLNSMGACLRKYGSQSDDRASNLVVFSVSVCSLCFVFALNFMHIHVLFTSFCMFYI